MRYQRGYVFEKSNAFHVRYSLGGNQRSQRLCQKDAEHTSVTCKAVQLLAAQVMARVNAQTGAAVQADVTVVEFWEQTYLPHLERTTKPSTLYGYQQLWSAHLSTAFAGAKLGTYQTHQATQFLTSLAERGLGVRTIAHVRSLASGIFRHALRLNRVTVNPWSEAGSLSPITKPEATHAYTLEEAEQISNALLGIPKAQLVFCLATFLGLRPGEISALQWEDITGDWIHIRRSAWQGIVGTTKTEESVASVPLIEPVRSMLSAWKQQSSEMWVFPGRKGLPMDLSDYAKRSIAPVLRGKEITWHGLYAGRRAAATLLVQLTGNAVAAQAVLRHKSIATTETFYVKPVQTAALHGMQLVEAELAQRKALGAATVGPEVQITKWQEVT